MRGATLELVMFDDMRCPVRVYNRAMWVGAKGDARQVEVEVEVAELAPKD